MMVRFASKYNNTNHTNFVQCKLAVVDLGLNEGRVTWVLCVCVMGWKGGGER